MAKTSLKVAAEAQRVLEGIPLPVRTEIVLRYAERQGAAAEVLEALRRLPRRKQFLRLDDIGEALAPVQPSFSPPEAHVPQRESGEVPGGAGYLDAARDPGWIRDEPEILEYEQLLVREPADEPEQAAPKVGSRAKRPRVRK